MSRLTPVLALCGWLGAVLVLSSTRWARRPALGRRMAPYRPVTGATTAPPASSTASLRDALGELARDVGDAVARAAGIGRDTERRLDRADSDLTVGELRTRQVTWAVVTLAAAGGAAVALGLPGPVALLVLVAAPTVAFLVPEQQLDAIGARRRERLVLELPVIAEQLGMLLATGHSLTGAVGRIATRGSGVAADDLGRVAARIRQGLGEHEALAEWADRVDVPALHRLVAVLALHRQAGDLGRLIGEEARSMRLESHRHLLEVIERRSQQVWIPVTVAALVPGLLFLSVPFIEALRRFGAA